MTTKVRTDAYVTTLMNNDKGRGELKTLRAAMKIINRTYDIKYKLICKGRGAKRYERFVAWKMETEGLTEAQVNSKYGNGYHRHVRRMLAQDFPLAICDHFDVYTRKIEKRA